MPRFVGILLEFLAQMSDVRVDGSVEDVNIVTPDAIEDVIAAERPVGMVDQEFQKSKLQGRQVHRPAVSSGLSTF